VSSFVQRLKDHPRGFWYVFWGELAERASFYGMRTILALYLTTVMGFERDAGAQVMQFFIVACYLTPLLGGLIADRWLGRYRTILYFSGPYIAGHLILGGIESKPALFVALGLLALGSGSIKPNTSTLMGQIYENEKKTSLLSEAFSYFYAAVNIGAAGASLLLPLARDQWGYGIALAIPAGLMAVAFALFAAGKRHYPVELVGNRPPKTPEQKAAERDTLRRVSGIFLLISFFWLVYDQSASTWIYFAKDHCDLTLFPGFDVTPDQIQGLNPLLIVCLTPVFNFIWEKAKERRGGVPMPDTRKMLVGFFIVLASMLMMSTAGFLAGDGKVSVWWLVGATLIITMGELCISVIGLEFAYRRASAETKSVVTAAFLLTVTIGNLMGGFIDRLYETSLKPGPYFALQAAIVGVAAVVFLLMSPRFERQSA
jgi:POT family proton-dependent oligopeptide transporter